jgi:hypothetical protein
MGKEILLTLRMWKTGSPSGSGAGSEVIRMHEIQTCEIPLLWRSGSAFWAAAAAVCAMPTHVDSPSEEAGSPISSDAGIRPAPSPRGRFHAYPALLQASGRGVAGVSISIPPGAAPLCCPPQSASDPKRAPRTPSRWSVVRVRRKAVGPIPDGAQTLSRQRRHLP